MPTFLCPTDEELAQFVDGRVPESMLETLVDHIDGCDDCQHRIERLESDDPLAQQLAELRGIQLTHSEDRWASGSPTTPPGQIEMPAEIGPYRLLDTIAVGGMGVVYEARHRRLGRPFAVKLLHSGGQMTRAQAERVRSEWRTHGRLVHPNIVSATDAGIASGQPYLVTERIDGIDLSNLIRRHGALAPADACEIIRQAADGLQYAHDQNVIHGDVKPSNLMLSHRGVIKLLDLGTAMHLDDVGHGASGGITHGTLAYMAPEQLVGRRSSSTPLDPRSDIYSLGCTFYCLLTGSPPFSAQAEESRQALVDAHRNTPPNPLIESTGVDNQDAISRLQPIVDRMLAKESSDRYPSMGAVLDEIEPYCQGNQIAQLVTSQLYSQSSSREVQPEVFDLSGGLTTLLQLGNPARRWRLAMTAGLLILVSVTAILLWYEQQSAIGPVLTAMKIEDAPTAPTTHEARVSYGEDIVHPGIHPATASTLASDDRWLPHPREGNLDGLALLPAKLPGVDQWQVETIAPRGRVRCIRWSPDGKRIAVVSADGHIRVFQWERQQLSLIDLISHRDHRFTSVDFHRGRDSLVATTETELLEIAAYSGQIIERVAITGIQSMQWVGKVDRIAVLYSAGIAVMDPGEFKQSALLPGRFDLMAWARDGERCVTVEHHSVRVRRFADDAFSEKVVREMKLTDTPRSLRYSPSKNNLVLAYSDRIEVFRKHRSQPTVSIASLREFESIAFGEDDDDLILGSSHGVMQVNATNVSGPIDRHQHLSRTQVAWCPTENVIAVGQRGSLRIIDSQLRTIARIGAIKAICDVAAVKSNRFAIVSRAGKIVCTNARGDILGWTTTIPDGKSIVSHASSVPDPAKIGLFISYADLGTHEVMLPLTNADDSSKVSDTEAHVRIGYRNNRMTIQSWDRKAQRWTQLFEPRHRIGYVTLSPDQTRVAVLTHFTTLNLVDYDSGDVILERKLASQHLQNMYVWIDNDTLLIAGARNRSERHLGLYSIDADRWIWQTNDPLDTAAAEVCLLDDRTLVQVGNVHSIRSLADGKVVKAIDVQRDYGRRHGRVIGDQANNVYLTWGYDYIHSKDANTADGVVCWDASNQQPKWMLMDLGEEQSATLSAAGQILSATPQATDQLIWILQHGTTRKLADWESIQSLLPK